MPPAGAARTRRCRGGTFGLGWHVTDGRLWWKDIGLLIDYVWRWMPGGVPPRTPRRSGGKAGVEPIPKQIDSGRRRPAVGRRARGGRSRWSRSTSPGAGRPGGCMGARAAAMWTRPGQRRRCTAARPVHEQARGEAGGGRRPGRRKYLCIRTNGRTHGQTHKNPEVGSFSLTSFL